MADHRCPVCGLQGPFTCYSVLAKPDGTYEKLCMACFGWADAMLSRAFRRAFVAPVATKEEA